MFHKKVVAFCFLLMSVVLASGVSFPVYAAALNFGYTSVGDSNASTFGGVYVSNFTSPAIMGDITQINVYLATGGTTAKAVIYADSNGQPAALLGESSPIGIEGTSGGWVSFNISYAASPNTVYWLGVVFQNAGTYYYSSSAGEHAIYSAPLSETLNSIPNGNYTKGNELSVFAIYTPSASDSGSGSWLQTGLFWIILVGIIIAVVVVVLFVVRYKKS